MAWEKEKVDLLLDLNKQEFSASQIAEKLGGGVTRNAVIGKLNRMGLSCGGGKPNSSSNGEARVKKIATTEPLRKQGRSIMSVPKLQPAEENIGVADLSDSTCRYPMGDPKEANFRFCGAKKGHEVLPYCDYHTQLAHQSSNRAIMRAEKAKEQVAGEANAAAANAAPAQTQRRRRAAG